MPNHKPGCDGEWHLVPCGSTHIHKCSCGARVRFSLMPYGCCAACDEIHDSQPTYGESRCARIRETNDDLESAREVLESLVA
jgi:hypothetical protein